MTFKMVNIFLSEILIQSNLYSLKSAVFIYNTGYRNTTANGENAIHGRRWRIPWQRVTCSIRPIKKGQYGGGRGGTDSGTGR